MKTNKLKNIKKFAKKRAAAADDNDAEAHALDAEVEAEANTVDAVAEEESNKRKAPASEKGQSCHKGKVQSPPSAPLCALSSCCLARTPHGAVLLAGPKSLHLSHLTLP